MEPKACRFLFYGVIRKKDNCCVYSGWLPVYVYFMFIVSSCYCQIEKGYGIVLFVCGVKFYGIVYFFMYVRSYWMTLGTGEDTVN